jgi:hypothetical protein
MIKRENIKLSGSPRFPNKKAKGYNYVFEHGINFVFSKDRLIALIKNIEINGMVSCPFESYYFFTDENIPASHLKAAKKDLERFCSPNADSFNKNVKKQLKKEKLWREV